jgi:hypothetical protein
MRSGPFFISKKLKLCLVVRMCDGIATIAFFHEPQEGVRLKRQQLPAL